MFKIFIGISIILFLASCEEKKYSITANSNVLNPIFPVDSIFNNNETVAYKTFNTGGGTGGYFMTFIDDQSFETFGFCDICPGSGTIGSYVQKSKEILMLDSLCYENEPHFMDSSVYIDCHGSTMTRYYLVRKENILYLSTNPKDTLNPEQAKIDNSLPRHEITDQKLNAVK